MYVKKLIVLVYANKTLYYILLENFWGIRGGIWPPSHPLPSTPAWKTCELLLWDLRGFISFNSTSVYQNKIHNQVLVESSCCKINKQWSETFEWDLKVTSVGTCVVQIQERRSLWIQSLYVVVSVSYY